MMKYATKLRPFVGVSILVFLFYCVNSVLVWLTVDSATSWTLPTQHVPSFLNRWRNAVVQFRPISIARIRTPTMFDASIAMRMQVWIINNDLKIKTKVELTFSVYLVTVQAESVCSHEISALTRRPLNVRRKSSSFLLWYLAVLFVVL